MSDSCFLSRRTLLAAALTAAAVPGTALAASGLRFICPFPAGGGGDTLLRALMPGMEDFLKTSAYVDNRPGAGGAMGTNSVIRGKADGETLLYVTNGTLCINPVLYPNLTADPLSGLTLIGGISELPLVLVVNAEKYPHVKNMQDFRELIRKKPESAFASAGAGTSSHLGGLALSAALQANCLPVPFKGGAQAMLALLSGQITFMTEVIANALPHIQAGKLRAIAVTSEKRAAKLPSVPSMKELGLPQMSFTAWDGIAVPRGTSDETCRRFAAALSSAVKTPAVRQRIASLGGTVSGKQGNAFIQFVKSETPKWRRLLSAASS